MSRVKGLQAAAPPLATAAVTFVCFLPALDAGFVNWLDDEQLLDQSGWRGLGAEHLRWMLTETREHYVPVMWLSFGLDHALWEMNPRGYHLTNLLIHAAAAGLFCGLLSALLNLDGAGRWAAALGALVFSIHPLRVESVVWLMGRRDVLSGFFLMLTLLAYLKAARGGPGRWRWLWAALAAYVPALLSKAIVMTAPLLMLLLDVYPLRRFGRERARAILLEKIPFLAAAALVAVVAFVTLRGKSEVAAYGLFPRLLQGVYGLAFYPIKTVLPVDLSPLYPLARPPDLSDPRFLASLVGVAIAAAALVLARRRWPAGLAAGAAYVVLLLPVLGLVKSGLHLVADRYSYLASLPLSALLAAALARPAPRLGALPALATMLLLVPFGVLTARQCRVWTDSRTLWTHAIRVDPTNLQAYLFRADAHRLQETDPAAVDADYETALRLDPDHPIIHNHYGEWLLRTGRPQRALRHLDRAVALRPDYDVALNNRGVALRQTGEPGAALEDFARSVALNPDYLGARFNRADLLRERGDAEGARRDLDEILRRAAADAPLRARAEAMLRELR
jgi:hypothetical protein